MKTRIPPTGLIGLACCCAAAMFIILAYFVPDPALLFAGSRILVFTATPLLIWYFNGIKEPTPAAKPIKQVLAEQEAELHLLQMRRHTESLQRLIAFDKAYRESRMNALTNNNLLDAIDGIVDSEPELPGEMPSEMWSAIRNDRDTAQTALRLAVHETKANIRARIKKAFRP